MNFTALDHDASSLLIGHFWEESLFSQGLLAYSVYLTNTQCDESNKCILSRKY